MSVFDWLVAKPVAHRGFHDPKAERFENTVSAARAAVERHLSIECDVQRSSDGEAMVFHDFTLDRLTAMRGPVSDFSARALSNVAIGGTGDHVMTLPAFLDAIGRRTSLICEIKSSFDGDVRLANRVAEIALGYDGLLALKSFDPTVIAHLRTMVQIERRAVPLGIVAQANYDQEEWCTLGPALKRDMAAMVHVGETRPDFLSFHVEDLPHAATTLFRAGFQRPVMTWTVRTAEQRRRAALWADQVVFEGFEP